MIYVDADACPVVHIVEQVAENNNIQVMLLCDTNHVLLSDYSEVLSLIHICSTLIPVSFLIYIILLPSAK